jgi:NAD+ synthase (glutamine-hydrolysing)
MCRLVAEAANRAGKNVRSYPNELADILRGLDKQVIADARRIAGEPEDSSYLPSDPSEFASRIFHTSYMGTENSGAETRRRAKQLAAAIGRYASLYMSVKLVFIIH